jgi:hypothetical protein
MHKIMKDLAFVTIAALTLAFVVNAQDTKTKVVMNPDGTYSVIEYPVGKEVRVKLLPMPGVSSTGMARVMRTANGTKVYFDVAGAPADWKDVYAYAVDPSGRTTYLGPISFSSGIGKAEFTTPADKFMLVVSPTEGLTTYDPTSTYYFRSEVPAGYRVIPRNAAIVTSSSAVTTVDTMEPTAVTYDVPMLGMAKFKGKSTELKLNFGGDMSGLQAHAYLKPAGGKTKIRMTFDDLQKAPMNKRFVLWTSSPEGYTKIGQIVHAGNKDTAEIRGETALSDFGLFLTVEDTDVDRPMSRTYSTFTVVSP